MLVGSYVTLIGADITKKGELRNEAYINLVALNIPWAQAIQTALEAQILTHFYETRYQRISHDPEDLAQAKSENQRFLGLIPRISDIQMDVFKNLAKVTIAYKMDDELTARIKDIFLYKTVIIKSPPDDVKTEPELDKWKEKAAAEVIETVKKNFNAKFDHLYPLLLEQLK